MTAVAMMNSVLFNLLVLCVRVWCGRFGLIRFRRVSLSPNLGPNLERFEACFGGFDRLGTNQPEFDPPVGFAAFFGVVVRDGLCFTVSNGSSRNMFSEE